MAKKQPSAWKDFGDASALGIELVVSVLIAGGAGWWLDKRFGTSPWLTVIGVVIGAAAGLRSAYRVMVGDEHRKDQD